MNTGIRNVVIIVPSFSDYFIKMQVQSYFFWRFRSLQPVLSFTADPTTFELSQHSVFPEVCIVFLGSLLVGVTSTWLDHSLWMLMYRTARIFVKKCVEFTWPWVWSANTNEQIHSST
jgi:hypothetical protein